MSVHRRTRKSSASQKRYFDGQHRFEHWYRDNQVYFITARCRSGTAAFETEGAQAIFWDRFGHWTTHHHYASWVRTLMNNHYHDLGYSKIGTELGEMMRKIHGSIAKLVNDVLEVRLVPFWVDKGHQDYFDGCIRDELQCRRAYRYVLTQSVRAGICRDGRDYPNTRVYVDLELGMKRALELGAFLDDVPYKRYDGY